MEQNKNSVDGAAFLGRLSAMLSVIVDARDCDAARLAPLLGQLTAGAVDGVVREVLLVARPDDVTIDAICEGTGAGRANSLEEAAEKARSPLVLAAATDFRFRDGWIGALNAFLTRGGTRGLVTGQSDAFFGPKPFGVLIERARAAGLGGADLHRLRRELGLAPVRIG